MDNELDPKNKNEDAADANEEAITGRAPQEEEFEDTDEETDEDDVDADADSEAETAEE